MRQEFDFANDTRIGGSSPAGTLDPSDLINPLDDVINPSNGANDAPYGYYFYWVSVIQLIRRAKSISVINVLICDV